jgi:transposase-like protein
MEMYKEFRWRHFKGEIILWAVRWYCKYGIGYRELEEMMAERGVEVDHTTLYRWVQSYAPELQKRLKWYYKRSLNNSWRVDETYIKVKGKWCYLYRAIDSDGHTIDFYLSPTRNAKAAQRFLGKALRGLKDWEQPYVINTNKAGSYTAAIRELKQNGQLPEETEHRQVKYLNNIIEADHGKRKRLIKPTLGFKSLKTAYATIKGFEAMRTLKKKQEGLYRLQEGIKGEVRLVERCFYLGNNALADAMEILKSALEKEPQIFQAY